VGAAAPTKYSITVTCRVAQAALPLVDEAITKARQWQGRLPTCLAELETLSESLKIAERKLLVVDKMIAEAELESKKAQSQIFAINKRLVEDDEFTTMLEDERRALIKELGISKRSKKTYEYIYLFPLQLRLSLRSGPVRMRRGAARETT